MHELRAPAARLTFTHNKPASSQIAIAHALRR
jgi:hypothetical protein